MQHIPQVGLNCFAYALAQIGEITEEALKEYVEGNYGENDKAKFTWAKKHAKWACKEAKPIRLPIDFYLPQECWDLSGKGLVLTRKKFEYLTNHQKASRITPGHAISFENHYVLDSAEPYQGYMSLESYLIFHPEWEVIKILPVKTSFKRIMYDLYLYLRLNPEILYLVGGTVLILLASEDLQ